MIFCSQFRKVVAECPASTGRNRYDFKLVAAVGEGGRVNVEVATLSAAGLLQKTVKDSDHGVRHDLETRLFEEEVSTKGAGRGSGVHLVYESVRLLRGCIEYSRDGGLCFAYKFR